MKVELLLIFFVQAIASFPHYTSEIEPPKDAELPRGGKPPRSEFPQALNDKVFDVRKYPYIGNGHETGQSRCGCPFLNSLANHGIIPYHGKNIHFDVIQEACIKSGNNPTAFKFSRRFMVKIARELNRLDIASGSKTPHSLEHVSLHELNMRNPTVVEHDLSVTRYDIDNPKHDKSGKPNPELVEKYIAMAPKNPQGKHVIGYRTTARFIKWRREEEDKVHKVQFGFGDHTTSAGELVFALELMGRNGKMTEDEARDFYIHERFPKDWTPASKGHLGFAKFNFKMMRLLIMYHMPDKMIQEAREKEEKKEKAKEEKRSKKQERKDKERREREAVIARNKDAVSK